MSKASPAITCSISCFRSGSSRASWTGGAIAWTRIEATSGTTELRIHLLMMAEIAIPITMGLLLEINALVISIMIAAFFVHQATAFWDVAYAERVARSLRPSSISTASWRSRS